MCHGNYVSLGKNWENGQWEWRHWELGRRYFEKGHKGGGIEGRALGGALQGRNQDLAWEGKICFSDLGICMSRIFEKWFNLVPFGVGPLFYLD